MIQQTSDDNKKLLPSEELLWHRILTKGVFRKKIVEGFVVTDQSYQGITTIRPSIHFIIITNR